MKVSSPRIFNKSKKAMSSKEFGIDFFVNESDLFAIFCVVKTGVEIGRVDYSPSFRAGRSHKVKS